jgi:rRNA maturation protein Nop10
MSDLPPIDREPTGPHAKDPSSTQPGAIDAPASAFEEPASTMHCKDCGYVLNHLPGTTCPECGRQFDPNNPATWSRFLPFSRWRYWLPLVLMTTALAVVSYLVLLPLAGFGWSATFAVPMMIGCVVGYLARTSGFVQALFGISAVASAILVLATLNFAGVICVAILLALAFVPLLVGIVSGTLLRAYLKSTTWDQRDWLPVLAFVLLPQVVAEIEERLAPPTPETVETVRVLDVPPDVAWHVMAYYEDVARDPPWLLRATLRSPVATYGSAARPGDRKTCLYERGHLVKQVVAVEPNQQLRFAVVEQKLFEDHSLRLTGGAFRFEAVDGGRRTRVTLSTEYVPLLRPRFAWQPAEAHVVHLLHGQVLEGMARAGDRRVADGAPPALAQSPEQAS